MSTALARISKPLSDAQKAALVTLLGDEDPTVYQTVREKILSVGNEALDWLKPHRLSSDPVIRRRVLEIVQHLARQTSDNRFLGFCLNQGEDLDVEEGSLLLAQTQYPDINVLAYQALFDSFASDLRDEIDFGGSAEAIIARINFYLFNNQRFRGNEGNYYDPDNSYLNRVVDNRTGNPITLCLIYLFVARRLKLPMAGIGMPGHFLCRYQSTTEELFVDAFNRGKLLSKADCVKYLVHTKDGFKEAYLAPVTPRLILLRTCTHLHQIYLKLGWTEEISRFQRYIVALAK
jgi:regulator of sirC expression with transglutaminase-like and TPR domain